MNLPPYISRTPPPLNETEDDEDEEFGTFAVCSDLGEEVCDAFEKTSHVIRSEDNVSEDSGFCMNSVGQTQSPCDISPLSSSYNKGNECMGIDNHGDIVLNSPISIKETDSSKTEDMKLKDSCCNLRTIDLIQNLESFHNSEEYSDSSDPVKMPAFSNMYKDKCLFSETSEVGINKDYFVDDSNSAEVMPDNSLVNETISQISSCSFISADSTYHQPTESNEIGIYTNTEQPVIENTFTLTKQFSDIESIREEQFNIQDNVSQPVENTLSSLQLPVLSTYNENNITSMVESGNADEIEIADSWNSDDEFSDFTSFQLIDEFPGILKPDIESQSQLEECETIHGDFTKCITETLQSAIENNIVWTSLQCFEETPAFKYQWSTSCTQMKFLQALQIDSRNILFGPWNKMNKFNWNDVSCSVGSSNYNIDCTLTSNTSKNKEIPDAHFDWITSGLINPLQGTSNEKETIHSFEENGVSEILVTRSRDVLNSLPKLNFLKSTYINFK